MKAIEPTNLPAWPLFEAEAKRRRHDPRRLLLNYMNECLESWKDADEDAQIAAGAQASDLKEADAVRLVREHRAGKAKAGR